MCQSMTRTDEYTQFSSVTKFMCRPLLCRCCVRRLARLAGVPLALVVVSVVVASPLDEPTGGRSTSSDTANAIGAGANAVDAYTDQ